MFYRVLYSLHGTSVLSFCTDVVLTLSICLITVTIVIILVNVWCCFICLPTYPGFSPYFTWDSVRSPINPGPVSLKEGLSMYVDFHYKIRRPWDSFVFILEISIQVRWHLYIEKAPRPLEDTVIILASLFVAKVHYNDVIMSAIASHITSLTIVYSIVYSDADHRQHQSSASLAFVRGIHWGPVNSPHKWPVTRKMCPFDDVIMR